MWQVERKGLEPGRLPWPEPFCCLRGRWHQERALGGSLILTAGSGKVSSPAPVLYPLPPVCFRNKYLLLNNQELNELSAISLKANIPEVEAVLNTDR